MKPVDILPHPQAVGSGRPCRHQLCMACGCVAHKQRALFCSHLTGPSPDPFSILVDCKVKYWLVIKMWRRVAWVCVGWLGLLFPLCAEKFLWVREMIHSNNSALNQCFQQAQLMHGCRRSACPDLLHGGGSGLIIKADIALVSAEAQPCLGLYPSQVPIHAGFLILSGIFGN